MFARLSFLVPAVSILALIAAEANADKAVESARRLKSGKSSKNSKQPCFVDNAELNAAVLAYMDQTCSTDSGCIVAQTYGWPMNSWCVGNVVDMSNMFSGMATFNEDISDWDVSSVNIMSSMFFQASAFNGDLSGWDVSNVNEMRYMFYAASAFNGDLSGWNVSNVNDMRYLFYAASAFNGDLSGWDVSNVNDMRYMFFAASAFNSDLSSWNISGVNNFSLMFSGASAFNQNLCAWRDTFPYESGTYTNIFAGSGCTNQVIPTSAQKGPFCASTCVSFFYLLFPNRTFDTIPLKNISPSQSPHQFIHCRLVFHHLS